jgi:hypothetical protein
MITEQHVEEMLSRAFVTAIAATAGLNASVNGSGLDYGTDGSIKRVKFDGGKRVETGFGIEYQAKATKNWRLIQNDETVAYDMEVVAHNALVDRYTDGGIPIYLILLCLPPDRNNWIELSHDELILRHCCYWHRITGPRSANAATTVVHIPRIQRLDPYTLCRLVEEMASQFS